MSHFFRLGLASFIFIGMACVESARAFEFGNINQSDLEKIVDELSANFAYTPVAGAAPLGSTFGFELGLLGGITQTPDLEKVVQSQDPSAKAPFVPHAQLLGRLSVPMGFTFDLAFIPELSSPEFKFSSFGLAAQWSLTESVLPDLPLSLAVRGHYSSVNLSVTQNSPAPNTKIEFEDTVMGLQFLASKDFVFIEPYVGLGYLTADGKLSGAAIFSGTLAGRTQASSEATGTQFLIGTEFKLGLLKIGAEYANHFSASRFTTKLSFAF